MFGLEIAILLLIEAVCGAGGALAVTRLWRRAALEWKSAAAIGVVGGLALTLLAAQVPGLAGFVGHVGSAIDATARRGRPYARLAGRCRRGRPARRHRIDLPRRFHQKSGLKHLPKVVPVSGPASGLPQRGCSP